MAKIYYDNKTGYLCERYPKDIEIKENTPFIEVDDETEAKTFSVETGKFWAVRNGKLQIVEDEEVTHSKEWEKQKLEAQLNEIREWFKANDWKPNKIITGEWSTDDERWTSYLEQRAIQRSRQDEINNTLRGDEKW